MNKIEFGHFEISDTSRKYINEVLNSNWFSLGEKVSCFEKSFANLFGYKYGIMVNSGTSANICSLLSLYQLGAKAGVSEVIVPGLSFIATGTSVKFSGLVPRFVDIDYDLQINTDLIEQAINKNTIAIMSVNLMGKSPKLDIIRDICNRHDLIFISDSCESYGCKYKGKYVLDYADMETTSHYLAHILQVGGEGGTVLTNQDRFEELIRPIRSHGRTKGNDFYHPMFGGNFKPQEMNAAIGLGEIEVFWDNFRKRKANLEFYQSAFDKYDDILYFVRPDDYCELAPHAFSFTFKNEKHTSVFQEKAKDLNLHIKTNFGAMNEHGALREYITDKTPIASFIGRNGFHIGVHKYLTTDDLEYVVKKLSSIFEDLRSGK